MVVRGLPAGFLALVVCARLDAQEPPIDDAASIEAGAARPAPAAPAPPPEVVPPKALSTPSPAYPAGARGDAVVELELTVGRDGGVREANVTRGQEPFASAALAAARSFRFEPATRGGAPISARVRFELRFHYEETAPAPEPEAAPAAPPGPATAPQPPTEVLVLGVRPEAPKTVLTRAEVREMPGTFGDPFRAVEVIPGVTPIVTGLPYFFVRGAPPGNVGYYLDGIRVPLLFHFALGPSVIHPGLVDHVDLYAGGYPARYGRFSGGIVAAETVAPKPEFHGEANVRIFDTGAMLEAPFAGGRGTALAAGRYSYTAGVVSLVAPEVTLAYWDYQLRASYALDEKNQIGLFGFGSYDLYTYEVNRGESAGASTQFHRVDLRWDRRESARTKYRTALTLGYDRTANDDNGEANLFATDRMVAGRFELEHRASERALFRTGADVTVDRVRLEIAEEPEPEPPPGSEADPGNDPDFSTVLPPRTDVAVGLYGDVVLAPERGVTVTPGLRMDLYHSLDAYRFAAEPRVSARFDLGKVVSIENSFGIVHQPPSFVIPIPGIEPNDLDTGLQKSVQSSAGVEVRLPSEWTASLTLFQNAFFELTDLLSLTRYADQLEEDVTFDTRSLGHTYGLEFVLRRPLTKRFAGYLAYTLSRSDRSIGRVEGVASFDRTHVLHVAGAYDLGRRWRAGTRLTLYSGPPARVEAMPDPSNRPIGAEGELLPEPPGGYRRPDPATVPRAPAFFRIDLRVEKRWLVGSKGAWVSFVFEIMNATLSREVVDYVCYTDGCRGEPIGPVTIPSIGVEAAF